LCCFTVYLLIGRYRKYCQLNNQTFKRFKRVPGILVAVVGATIAVAAFDLSTAGVKVLGPLPQACLPWLPEISP
jgi:MFS superfamily sulfate permease-like transporter